MDSQALLPTVLAALERVAASTAFSRSERHRSLLRHLVEKAAAGRGGEIKETTIALEVFGRRSYDPQVDAHVRVEIGKLRDRLERFYAAEGQAETVRIEIPRGSYVPVFHSVAASSANGSATERTPAPKHRVQAWIAVTVLLAAGAAAAVVLRTSAHPPLPAARTSIAVLPFTDLDAAHDLEYFASGLTDQLIGDLASLQVFRVVPRSAVAQYKERPAGVRKIGEQLNVHAVVEGTVRREGSRLRIEVRLTETREGLLLWMDGYDRDFSNILEIQRELAESVARAFNRGLYDTTRALVRQRTRNHEAYHSYLRAAWLYTNDPPRSIEYYRAAVAADPDYALAWAGLAAAWIRLDEFEMAAPEAARPEALAAAARAVSLDPELAESHWVSGVAKLYYQRDWGTAEAALRRAVELDRMHGRFRWEYPRLILIPTGRFRECVDQVKEAIELEPSNPILYNLLANCHIKGRQFKEAEPYLEASRNISPHSLSALVLQGMAAAGRGEYERALQRFEEAARLRRSTWVLGYLAHTLAKMGRMDQARMIAVEMERRAERGFRPHFDLAVAYTALGERERALESLERTLAAFSPNILWIKVDYRLDDLRDHPRFEALVKAVGLD